VEEDGCVRVPQVPGLGVTLNEETIEKYRFMQK
jgi:L-alanine-DL-glutamate epimerase-like enolase superfamily enzyme